MIDLKWPLWTSPCKLSQTLRSWPNEVVPFLAHPTPEVVALILAIWKSGKIAFPLNPKLPNLSAILKELAPPPTREKVATYLLTSGSSGKPKIAMLSWENHYYSALASHRFLPLEKDDVMPLTLPLFHVSGLSLLVRSYLAGSTLLFSDDWSEATYLSLVPTQLRRLRGSFPRLKGILLGGAPLSPAIHSPYKILPTYGMTEMSSQIATCGEVLPHTELQIRPDGEIWVKGKTLFQGYLREGLPLEEEGWFATKDLGRWGENGLEIIGRKDNLIISGGENIQPEEIELLVKSLGAEEAIVVGVSDPDYGARPALFMRPLRPQILQELKSYLPTFKIPIWVRELPPYAGLKPNRKELVEKCCQ